MKRTNKTKTIYQNKQLTEKLENDEILYVLTVADAQEIAKKNLGRELNYDEMYQVRKGIEWGFFDWEEILSSAIDDLEMDEKINDI
jgi:hypothetical protein